MATTPENPRTEYVIDLHNQHSTCDLFATQRNSDQETVERETDSTSLFACSPQSRPNDRFYCTDNEFDEKPSKIGGLDRERQSSEGEGEGKPPVKQAAEVAAAARFISTVDVTTQDKEPVIPFQIHLKPRLGSSTSVRDSILDSSLNVPRSRPPKMQMHSFSTRSKTTRPPPLQLGQVQPVAEEIQTPLPQRTSSKGAPSFDIARGPDSAKQRQRSVTSPSQETEPKTPLHILTPESANTFRFDFSVPSEPRLSRSASGATTDSQSPPTPPSGPTEDQIRREIEAFALEQGPHLRGSQRRTRRLPTLSAEDDRQDAEPSLPSLPRHDDVDESLVAADVLDDAIAPTSTETVVSSTLPRKKSIFGWLQKKPEVEVDDLIDLYFTDEQKDDVKIVKRKASKPRLPIFRNRVVTDPLPSKAG